MLEHHVFPTAAICFDLRCNKYGGSLAYNNATRNPDNAAVLFKRLIGTSTPVKLPAVNLTMTPEECSAEVLRALYGYLPEEIRGDRSEEHTSELQSLMRISYDVFCLKKKTQT